jgi:prepilin-type processing-associated H-X9-DG protein
LTNYVGVAGARGNNLVYRDPVWSPYAGLFDNRTSVSLTLVSNADGTSNTLMFGEGTGLMAGGVILEAWSWMGIGAMPTMRGLGGPTEAHWSQFASRHIGVVNFAFADGRVQAVSRRVDASIWLDYRPNVPSNFGDWWTLQYMSGFQDGMVADKRDLVP